MLYKFSNISVRFIHAQRRFYGSTSNTIEYVQGQSPSPGIREYFYYIDHEGYLFLDDTRMKNFTSCFKDKPFLRFFFDRLKRNTTDRFIDAFPFLSVCGRERNFIRCDDLPIVFTQVVSDPAGNERLSYAHGGELLTVSFEPQKIYMSENSGRVYHPADTKHGGIGLVGSKLSIELSRSFEFDATPDRSAGEFAPPIAFAWNGKVHRLDRQWTSELADSSNLNRKDFTN